MHPPVKRRTRCGDVECGGRRTEAAVTMAVTTTQSACTSAATPLRACSRRCSALRASRARCRYVQHRTALPQCCLRRTKARQSASTIEQWPLHRLRVRCAFLTSGHAVHLDAARRVCAVETRVPQPARAVAAHRARVGRVRRGAAPHAHRQAPGVAVPRIALYRLVRPRDGPRRTQPSTAL
jgi:hypothetical protein